MCLQQVVFPLQQSSDYKGKWLALMSVCVFCFCSVFLHTHRVIPASWRNWERSSEMKFWRSLKVFCEHIFHTATYGISAAFKWQFQNLLNTPANGTAPHLVWQQNYFGCLPSTQDLMLLFHITKTPLWSGFRTTQWEAWDVFPERNLLYCKRM